MNKTRLAGLLALLVLLAPVLTAAPALASETVQFDGEEADASDVTNTTVLTVDSSLENVTVQMTEDQAISADGSIVYNTNATAASAEVASSSGSGTLEATVNDGNITVEETGSSSATLEALNVTFNVTTDSDEDGINVSEATDEEQDLIQDDDESEEHTYLVVDQLMDVSYDVVGPAGGELNASEGEYEPNSTGEVQFVFDLTRNDTTYENYSTDSLKFAVSVNTTYFSDISEETSEDVDRIVLEDISQEDGERTFVWAIQDADNVTDDHWNDITVKLNATVESGEANETLVHTETHDPAGGVEESVDTEFDHVAGGTIAAPQFFSVGELGMLGAIIGLAVVGGLAYYFGRERDWMEAAGVAGVIIGLTMVADWALGMIGTEFNPWTDFLVASGGSEWMVIVVGIAITIVALGGLGWDMMGRARGMRG